MLILGLGVKTNFLSLALTSWVSDLGFDLGLGFEAWTLTSWPWRELQGHVIVVFSAIKLFCAPASSAPVEYVFSQGGLPSALWRCWLGSGKGIRPVKNWAVGCWHGICLERGVDLHMAQLMPLPLTASCFSKIQTSFTFLVPADPGSPGQRAVKRVCVYVCGQLIKT